METTSTSSIASSSVSLQTLIQEARNDTTLYQKLQTVLGAHLREKYDATTVEQYQDKIEIHLFERDDWLSRYFRNVTEKELAPAANAECTLGPDTW